MVLRKSFYIRWSAGRSPRVHEVNPGRDPSVVLVIVLNIWTEILFGLCYCASELPMWDSVRA